MKYLPIFASIILFASSCREINKSGSVTGGVNPEDALSTLKVAEGFSVELIASEPLISDPVAMEIDESGNLFVLEMHGYPLDTRGTGFVKLLTDSDDDGFPDKSTVYADNLVLPTGIMRWKRGIIVTDPPEVLYFEDTDGDGHADRRDTLLTGFARSNPQHNANTPVLGIDNWIYVAHERDVVPNIYVDKFGDKGSAVHFSGENSPELPRNAGGKSVRFKPDNKQLEMLSGDSQFGQTFDSWGHLLGTSNAHHLFHEVIAARYVGRNQNLRIGGATQLISDHGHASEVYPITTRPEHQLLTDVGVITSSCGVTWYSGGVFPDPYSQVTFIAEPVHNLVHADILSSNGASFSAGRLFSEKEFFASTDSWCRPVNFYIGPDGALYIIDYYRRYIEHPEWMDEETASSDALYEGTDRGRIYRVVPKGAAAPSWLGKLNLGSATGEELVGHLSSPNLWWRRNAQRLLVDRGGAELSDLVHRYMAHDPTPEGFAHALWILAEKNALTSGDVLAGLTHSVSGVRENAIKIAEQYIDNWPELKSQLINMVSDTDPKVRFQLLCTLGFLSGSDIEAARQQITFSDIDDYWVQVAALSAEGGAEVALLKKAIPRLSGSYTAGRELFFQSCATVIGLSARTGDIKSIVDLALAGDRSGNTWWKAGILAGLVAAMKETGNGELMDELRRKKLLSCFAEGTERGLRTASLDLLRLTGLPELTEVKQRLVQARHVAQDRSKDDSFRGDALRLIALSGEKHEAAWIRELLSPTEPESVQESAMLALIDLEGDTSTRQIISLWSTLSPRLRSAALRQLLNSDESVSILLEGIEAGTVGSETLEWPFKVSLMNYDEPAIRSKARTLLTSDQASRKQVIDQYQSALELRGSAENGKFVFERNCSMCHQINNTMGTAFGPDLASVRNRERQFILNDILLPNRSIADGYDLWTVRTARGETYTGVLSGQTSQSITLRTAIGEEISVARNDINHAQSAQSSAMPEGLEAAISVEEMADLLAYLKGVPPS